MLLYLKKIIDFDLLFQLNQFLTKKRKIQLFGILILMTLASILEIIALASVFPFLAIIAGGSTDIGSGFLEVIFESLLGDNSNPINQKIRVVILFTTLNIISGGVNLINEYIYGRISARIGIDLASSAYASTFKTNFTNLKIDKPDKITSNLTIDITRTISVYRFYIQMLSAALQSLSILIVVISLNIIETYYFTFILLGAYIVLTTFSKRTLRKWSKRIGEVNNIQIKNINSSYSNARENILRDKINNHLNKYRKAETKLRIAVANSVFFGVFPKYIFGPVGLCSIALFSLILSLKISSYDILISIVGSLALAMQKLLPALQNIFKTWTGIQSNAASVYRLKERIRSNYKISTYLNESNDKLTFFKNPPTIQLKDCFIRYPSVKKDVKLIDLKIDPYSKIGLVGSSGTGKSTLLDVISGLIIPKSGKVLLNDQDIFNKQALLLKWRNSIAYLAQDYFLESASILENIIANSTFNKKKLMEVLEISQANDFINELPNKLDTMVGNRGYLLSGGQRQRIALCRSLYQPFSLLILDEATSSLNKNLEQKIVNSIFDKYKNKTIIISTHKPEVLKNCEKVYDLDKFKK